MTRQRTYSGRVTAAYPPESTPEALAVQVQIDGNLRPQVGDTVELRVVLTDEEIGRRLRGMLLGGRPKPDKRGIRDLADEIEGQSGWPVLAELIREIVDGN